MLPTYGKDRGRILGERLVLYSPIVKGWVARKARTTAHSHADHPGTAVQWDEKIYEVVEAVPSGEGVRYVLTLWREEDAIRTLEQYDEASEAERIADHERARRQRKASIATRIAGPLAGFLPEPVQRHLQHELGVSPVRMTLLSCAVVLLLAGISIYDAVSATMERRPPFVPGVLSTLAIVLLAEAGVRFFVTMSQGRGMGSFIGLVGYSLFWVIIRRRLPLPHPFHVKGESATFTIPSSPERDLEDTLILRGPLLTLLPVQDQRRLQAKFGFDYRKHASGLTWGLLIGAALGLATSYEELGTSASATFSFLLAGAVALEQVLRLLRLPKGPASSVFGYAVRPFMRDLLGR
jgi:hypothetical protein